MIEELESPQNPSDKQERFDEMENPGTLASDPDNEAYWQRQI